jgi:hypothetical protein
MFFKSILSTPHVINYRDSFYRNRFVLCECASPEQWQSFAHEVAHIRYHIGNQLVLPVSFSTWQEWRANSFMLEFCVPRFLLEKCIKEQSDIHPIEMIVKNFNVTHEFALQRFRRYQMNVYHDAIVCGGNIT